MTRFALFFLAALTCSCSSGKQEAASLVAAVDRFHRAENAERPERASALAAIPCTDTGVCEAKSVCQAATKATADALVLKAEVESKLGQLRRGSLSNTDETAKALPEKLDRAERLLDEGLKAMPACDQRILALRARFDL